MDKGMKRGLAEMRREISRDTKGADPGLAERLRKAGPLDGGGISAFAGAMNADGDYIVELANEWLHADLLRSLKEGRPAFFVRGKVVGTGSDGDSLLAGVAGVEPVPPSAAVASDPPSRALEEWNAARAASAPSLKPEASGATVNRRSPYRPGASGKVTIP